MALIRYLDMALIMTFMPLSPSEGRRIWSEDCLVIKSRPTSWPQVVGLFLIPTLFALLQGWAIQSISIHLEAGPLIDEAKYIAQARLLQDEPITLQRILEFGLYPVFLSQFDLGIRDWSVASTDQKILAIGAAQSLMLQATSALFLFCAFNLITGNSLKRIVISVLLGGILLSPLVVVWPTMAMTEAISLSVTLLLACACLTGDARKRWSPILIAITCCLLVFVRDPMFLFVWMFVVLLLANNLFAKMNWTLPMMIGTLLMLIAIGLGITKVSLLPDDPRIVEKHYLIDRSQTLGNIIQLRILPDVEHRSFFVERGLPNSPEVMARSGMTVWDKDDWWKPDSELSDRPDFVAYRDWLVKNGFQTYLTFLLTHPGYLLRSIVHSPNAGKSGGDFHFSITDLLSIPYLGYGGGRAPYPQWLSDFLLAPLGWLIPSLYLTMAAIRYIWQTANRQRASSLVDIAAIAAGGAVFATYHADAWDLWRHTVPFILLIYISLITRMADIAIELVRLVRHRSRDKDLREDLDQVASPGRIAADNRQEPSAQNLGRQVWDQGHERSTNLLSAGGAPRAS
jgi:hypothetical protein